MIGAITGPDAEPVSRERLATFAAGARLPRGGEPSFQRGPGFGLVSVPAVRGRKQPDAGAGVAEGALPVVVDGTIDNRAEVAHDLGLNPDATPSALISAAYRRWGEDCVARLVGEFAFILWDPLERHLFAARDALGLRELFFLQRDGRTLVSSQLQMLLPGPGLSDLDEDYIADFLVAETSRGAATPFKSARRLEAGHWLVVRSRHLATRRYWDPLALAQSKPLKAGYEEEFLAILREAVERCLNTDQRTWAELSGGLDSSSIVCLSHQVLADGAVWPRDFATVTCVWDETPQSDERAWVDSVTERYRIRNFRINCDDLFLDDALEAAHFFSEPQFGILCHPICKAQCALLHDHDVGGLLSGARAEAVVLTHMTPPAHLADYLRALRLPSFLRELHRWQVGSGRPLANLAASFVLSPLLRPGHHVLPREDPGTVEPWIDRDFARRMRLRDRARGSRVARSSGTIAQRMQIENLARTEQTIARGFIEWSCEIRHPFLYRPLVEHALRIPLDKKISPTIGKPLLRAAMNGILPEKIRTREGSRGPGPAAYKAFAKRWRSIEEVVRSSRLVSMGVFDGPKLLHAAELVRFGASPGFAAFTACLALEYWLGALAGDSEVAHVRPHAG